MEMSLVVLQFSAPDASNLCNLTAKEKKLFHIIIDIFFPQKSFWRENDITSGNIYCFFLLSLVQLCEGVG